MRFPQADLGPQTLLETIYPVGCLYPSVVATNPAVLFGFGTWVAFGAGRALVGVDPGDSDFDAAEKTSGAKTVTLTAAQSGLPAHGHTVNDPGHSHVENSNNATTGALRGWGAADTSTSQSTATGYSTASAVTGLTISDASAGGASQAHSNVQPSIAIYLFKRTA